MWSTGEEKSDVQNIKEKQHKAKVQASYAKARKRRKK